MYLATAFAASAPVFLQSVLAWIYCDNFRRILSSIPNLVALQSRDSQSFWSYQIELTTMFFLQLDELD